MVSGLKQGVSITRSLTFIGKSTKALSMSFGL